MERVSTETPCLCYGRPPKEARWKKGQSGNAGPKKPRPCDFALYKETWIGNKLHLDVARAPLASENERPGRRLRGGWIAGESTANDGPFRLVIDGEIAQGAH